MQRIVITVGAVLFTGRLGNILGEEAETEVFYALTWLRGDGEIQDFYQTPQFSRQDCQGIDFVVFATNLWFPIPFQVKRSSKYARIHRKKYPHIPLVVVSRGEIRKQIRKIIHEQLALRNEQRQVLMAMKRNGEALLLEKKCEASSCLIIT